MIDADGTVRRRGRLLALLALAALVVASLQRMDLGRAVAQLADVQLQWLVLAVACYAAILPMWAWQWRLLAPRSPDRTGRRMFGVVAMTSAVLNTTPLLVGEAAGVVLLVTRAGIGRAAAMSVLAMDQLLVGAAKLLVLAAAALVAPLPTWMTSSILGLLAGLLALGAALAIASWRHADVEATLRPLVRSRAAAALAAFSRALAPLRAPDRIAPAFALAVLKKLAEVCAIVCVQRAFGVHLPFANGIVVLAVLNLATLLPVVPGNVGVYEAAVMLALTRQGIAGEQALGIAVVQHVCYFLALAGPGLLWAGRRR